MKILLIGPLTPPFGGATVLFRQLVNELQAEPEIIFDVIRTNPESLNKIKKILYQPYFLILMMIKIWKYDVVSYHASISGGYKLSFFVRIICLFARKPWVFRGFGGNYANWYETSPGWQKKLFQNTVLKADIVLFETRHTVNYFHNKFREADVQWYPNSRKYNFPENVAKSATASKFVYIGHVKESKGIKILLETSKTLPEKISIDVYGPFFEGMTAKDFENYNVSYQGVLSPDQVPETLSKYDALVFPSFYIGEGYPGVILEAYACGLPVITTNWKEIPEIVDESSGLLIEPGDPDQLEIAILTLFESAEMNNRLQKGAYQKAAYFESKKWTHHFVELCNELCNELV